jgi:cytosine/adenosine deaminase-related metal-dependent hydrolase/ubiquinone/menaquinone biosynthesis C-methylase UbiE
VSVAMTSITKASTPSGDEWQREKFALWSTAYDESPNPMLSLEERFLAPILPELRDKDIVDVGCGTGRWLGRIEKSAPRSITGIDISPEMLDRARRKLAREAVLVVGNATSLPIASTSADVVMASFVAGYVAELPRFAAELHRVARRDSRIYISDLHPDTAVVCNWERTFCSGRKRVGLTTHQHSLPEVIDCFRAAGFEATCLLEPPFGLAELETFRTAGKLESFYAAAGLPAIYILELRPITDLRIVQADETRTIMRLAGARVSLDEDTAIVGDVAIQDRKVASISTSDALKTEYTVARADSLNLDGYLLLPGLINAHDHLEFGLYPNLGRGPYANYQEWAADIQTNDGAIIAAQESVPQDVRVWWGAIRNLLCGVTTVCHHNPLHAELLTKEFPLRVIRDFGWGHSLAMDAQVEEKFRRTPRDTPFVLHACEGLDQGASDEIFQLDRAGMLDHRTVLIHGLALSAEGVALLNRRDASLVWCPSSNRFLFGRTREREDVVSVRHLLLGSDSPLTAIGNLLDEVRIAHDEVGIPSGQIYRILLQRAATTFRLRDGEGTIRPGATADLIAVRDRGLSPAETITSMTPSDIELVIVHGRVQVASETIMSRLSPDDSAGLQPLQVDSEVRWIRAPLGRLFHEAERALGCELKIGGKRVRHVCTAWL